MKRGRAQEGGNYLALGDTDTRQLLDPDAQSTAAGLYAPLLPPF